MRRLPLCLTGGCIWRAMPGATCRVGRKARPPRSMRRLGRWRS